MVLKIIRDSEGRPCPRCRDKTKRYATGWCSMHWQMALDEMTADPRYEPDDANDPGHYKPGEGSNYMWFEQERW